jgi:hypothetical protein
MSLPTVGSVRKWRTVGKMMTSHSRGSMRSLRWVKSGPWTPFDHCQQIMPATPTSWSPSMDSPGLWFWSQPRMRAVSQLLDLVGRSTTVI